jgi:hypothetical protein
LAGSVGDHPRGTPVKTWLWLPPAVRVVVIAAVWLGYAVLVSDLDAVDPSSQGAKLIWTAVLVGAAVTVGIDLGWRPKFGSLEDPVDCNRALRNGELSTGINLDVWRGWLRRNQLASSRTTAER